MCHSIVDPIINGENVPVYVIYTNNNYQKNNLELQYKTILLLRQSILTPCEVSLSWDHSKHNSQRIIESIKALVRTWWHLKITMSFLELYPTQLNRTKIVFSSNMSYFFQHHIPWYNSNECLITILHFPKLVSLYKYFCCTKYLVFLNDTDTVVSTGWTNGRKLPIC